MRRRADGRWLKVITIDGKKHYFYSSEDTEKKAERDINRQLLEYKEKQDEGIMFAPFSEKWSSKYFETIENNSLKAYRPGLKDAQLFFEDTYIKDISPSAVEKYINYQINNGLAFKTVKNRLLVLNLVMKSAVVEGYIASNPCQYIKVPRNLKKTQRRALTDDEIQKVKSSIDESETCFLAAFILMTGCRRGEAFALTYNDINFEEKTITINKTVEWIGNKPQIKDHPKSEAGIRTVPIPNTLYESLIKRTPHSGLVFANKSGELYGNTDAFRMWKRYQKEYGLDITPHQLRHAYASILYDANIDVKTAQTLMGHADIQTTLNIYTHLTQSRKESAADKLNKYLN